MTITRQPYEQWQLEATGAGAYEKYLVAKLFTSLADDTLAHVGLKPTDRLLDAACGTGIVARRAAPIIGQQGTIFGYDLNDSMLQAAILTSADLDTYIEWKQGNLVDMPYADESFDVIVCQQALQFLPSPVDALREMRRVLDQNGRIALSVWRSINFHVGYKVFSELLDQYVGQNTGMMMRSPFPNWTIEHLRGLMEEAGFQDIHININIRNVRYDSPAAFLREEEESSPLAATISAINAEIRTAFVSDIASQLSDYADDDGLIFPLEAYLVTARR